MQLGDFLTKFFSKNIFFCQKFKKKNQVTAGSATDVNALSSVHNSENENILTVSKCLNKISLNRNENWTKENCR